MGKKLDLSKLSEEEAKHVWDVVQRDINLRKIEEERIEDLKEKVEKESSKRELLSNQSHLNETHCMHCLQPFQFLINSKRQCKDCQFHVCKNCSRYNKKELGWVCDSCRVDRLVKVGSLDWYYDHVRSRFKRFGSAKVMRSLYMRHQSDARGASGLQNKVYSLPDINREYLRQARAGMFHDEDEDLIDSAEAQRYNMSFSERPSTGRDATSQKESLIAEADLASMFHHILQEQGQNAASPEQEFSTEVRLTVNSRRLSLENTRRPKLPFLTESQISNHFPDPQLTRTRYLPKGSPSLAPKGSQYSGDMDTSDEEGGAIPKVPPRRRSRASSQENVHHSGGQISDLNKRMSTIERMLNRLEERLSVNSDESTGPGVHTDADIEEETLKRKLGELASNISDKGGSSDEEKISKPKSSHKEPQTTETQKRSAAQALTDITAKTLRTINATERVIRDALGGDFQRGPPNISQPRVSREAQGEFQSLEEDVYMAAEKAYTLDKNLRDLEERARQSGTTDSELSELEVSVASAIAQVQQTESEVSDIESRIAALSAAGMTVSPVDKAKRKSSSRVFAPAISRSTEPFQESTPDMYSMSSPSDAKILAMQQALRKKFNIDPDAIDLPVEKSALYRGSLTQRNPNGKNRKADRIFSKPIVNQR
ncbi:melanophilin isoform X4 [Xenopus tropicalis]|uniref:Melanophilin isoform X4 n=1 Tax=Xenopus tropicalis TaxID=8364 RepID=A0A8J0SMV6_XENTR|nr:melanophilin isoform X4 [Xenopus tropicalis]